MTIKLNGLRLYCNIGVDANEQLCRQAILLDLALAVSAPLPAEGDSPPPRRPAVDYAKVADALRTMAEDDRFGLLEEFATAVARRCLAFDAVESVRVYVCKPKLFTDLEQAGVELTLSRQDIATDKSGDDTDTASDS